MKRLPLLLLLLATCSLSSCWLPSTAEYRARRNRPAARPEPAAFELHVRERPFEVPASYRDRRREES